MTFVFMKKVICKDFCMQALKGESNNNYKQTKTIKQQQ